MAKFGHLPSPDGCLGLGPISGIALTSGPLPDEWHEPMPPALEQRHEDCVAHATAVAICHAQWADRGRPSGKWPELASRAFIHATAQLRAGQTLSADVGTYIHSAFEALGQLGFPKESSWTYVDEHMATPPDWEALRDSIDQMFLAGARRIVSYGPQRATDVATAIAAGSVVVLGSRLDKAFLDLGPSDVWPGLTGEIVGGHAMACHAYRTAAGRLQFGLRSSWGHGYADNGTAWIDDAAMTSMNMSDLWILERAPAYSE